MTPLTDGQDRASIPAGYRSLLITYPRAWRIQHGAVVLDTVLALHADSGRTRPSVGERLRFAIDGLRVRLATRHAGHPVRRFASVAALTPVRSFDQTNGVVRDSRPLDEFEQVHANAAQGQNADEQRTAAFAWFRLDAMSRPDRTRHSARERIT